MKLTYKQIEGFVKKPDRQARVILVYGPDDGLMRERAKTMALTVVSDLNDPFNAATLSTSGLLADPARLGDEANAISMMGGDRLIRIEDASDSLTPLIKEYLAAPSLSALVILEAGELGPKSSLRKLCEVQANAAAVPCYVEDERDMSRLIREALSAEKLSAEPDAVSWLAAAITGDRQKARREIEKLIVYKGADRTPVSLEDVQACCGEAGAQSLDDLVYGAAGRNAAKALKALDTLFSEGMSFVVVQRSLANHFRRLHLVKGMIEEGASPEEAMKKLNPPIFFKQEEAFRAQVRNWSLPAIEKLLSRLGDLEASCKQTGAPVETLCAQAVLSISGAGR